MSDPIVIVSAARTPIAGLLGDFANLAAWELGAVAIKAAVERAGVPGDAVDEVLFGNCLMAGARARRRRARRCAGRPARFHRRRHDEQDVRLGHARDDVRARHAAARNSGERDAGRRHGEHDQRAAPDVRAQGIKYGARPLYDHMARRPGRRLRARQGDGRVRRTVRGQSTASRARRWTSSPFATTRSKKANEDGSFDWEIAPVTLQGPPGDTVIKFDEQPFKAKLDKIPWPQARVQERRRDHRRHLVEHLRRRGRLVLMRESTAADGRQPVARIVSHADARAGAGMVHHRAGGRIDKALKKAGWGAGTWTCGSQRSLRRGDHGRDGRVQAAARHRQRARRRLRAGPSDRRLGRAHRRHAAPAPRKRAASAGVAALCIGGGEATALAVELL